MIQNFKILPLLIIVAFLAFSVRLSDVVIGISDISNVAMAKEKPAEKSPKNKEDKISKNANETDEKSDEEKTQNDNEQSKNDEIIWKDASDSDFDVNGVKLELFNDLSKRRKELDKQEHDLQAREALLNATQKEIERKYLELDKLRSEIKGLLDKQSEEENSRILSLVKIYEGMKPKDAARIFNTLDLDVLIAVVSKMSERKTSPVLAAMNPERVRTITIMLAEQKKLPSL